ncbi:MAG: DUF664 domain-containing protein [Acidimicrobiia bacterium]|nr:DUF664 domain-containing protein [Acidimicrobiia bacterium]
MVESPELQQRVRPPFVANEREMLDAWLDYHRATLLWKASGLSPEELVRRSAEPSTLSLIGLVRHMSEVERQWFREYLNDEDVAGLYYNDEYPDGDFDLTDPATVERDLATYKTVVQGCREIAAEHTDLDAITPRPRRGQALSLRWILLHMIEEYARHNGHADLLRERIDGATGD